MRLRNYSSRKIKSKRGEEFEGVRRERNRRKRNRGEKRNMGGGEGKKVGRKRKECWEERNGEERRKREYLNLKK